MQYEKLMETINMEISFIDILCLTANLHLGVKHVDHNEWSLMFSKAVGRRFLKLLIDYEVGVPNDILNEYKKVFEGE
jgi:hypothetical protein